MVTFQRMHPTYIRHTFYSDGGSNDDCVKPDITYRICQRKVDLMVMFSEEKL